MKSWLRGNITGFFGVLSVCCRRINTVTDLAGVDVQGDVPACRMVTLAVI